MENAVQKFVAYYRVSTHKQGLGLDAQRATAQNFIKSKSAELMAEFSEKESGKRDNLANRVELQKALEMCKRQNCTLLVAKLDRLARDVEFIFHLLNSGVRFTACDLPDFNTMTGGVMAVMAQHEREVCSKRTKDALQAKKAQGAKLGSLNGVSHVYTDEDRAKGCKANSERADKNLNNKRAWNFISSMYKEKTLQELADLLTADGYLTASGRVTWKAVQVSRLIERYA